MGRSAALAFALALAASLLGAGCSSTRVSVKVESKPEANGGAPFYMVVRAVEQASFVTESYESVAAKMLASPADPTVLKAEVVYPGDAKEVVVEKPKDQGLGVYFLFTKPGERWKTARNAPLPDDISVVLGSNQIDTDE